MCKWLTLDGEEDFSDLLGKDDEVLKLKSMQLTFDNGVPTAVTVELKDGHCLHFCSRRVDDDGNRDILCISTTKGAR